MTTWAASPRARDGHRAARSTGTAAQCCAKLNRAPASSFERDTEVFRSDRKCNGASEVGAVLVDRSTQFSDEYMPGRPRRPAAAFCCKSVVVDRCNSLVFDSNVGTQMEAGQPQGPHFDSFWLPRRPHRGFTGGATGPPARRSARRERGPLGPSRVKPRTTTSVVVAAEIETFSRLINDAVRRRLSSKAPLRGAVLPAQGPGGRGGHTGN